MKIAINTLSAQTGAGISMLANLIPRLARIDQKNQYVIFYSSSQASFVQTIPMQFKKAPVRYMPRNPFLRVLWEQLVFPFFLLLYRADVLYSVGNTTSILAPCKIALLIENANPYSKLNLPWSFKERVRLTLLRALGWLSARRATKIRFVSQNSLDRIAPQLGVSLGKCAVIPHGVSFGNINSERTVLDEPQEQSFGKYILTIGANGPHRNTARLLSAFSILITKYGYSGDLVVVGNTGSRSWRETLDTLASELSLGSKVVFKDEVPHRDVAAYFKYTEAFVFPSIEETFGIPLLEAMMFGVPIAVSDCDLDTTHRGKCFNPFYEICGDAVHYFNPFDVHDTAQGMHRILTDATLRERLIARGKERVRKYNLENTARELVQLFENVYNT